MPEPENICEVAGESLGEAKWAAVRELQSRFPGMAEADIAFEVVSQGEGEAHVRATADLERWRGHRMQVPAEPAERVRAVVERVLVSLGLRATVDVEEDDDAILARVNGEELGPLIGKQGRTIDALQLVCHRAASPQGGIRKRVIVDAAGYRERREAALTRRAEKAAREAVRSGRPVELEPMSSPERRIVHNHLREIAEVESYSEGDEPNRHLVVAPLVSE